MLPMASVESLPLESTVHSDARGGGRAMRVTWHPEAGEDGLVVLSIWHDRECVGTFRLESREVPALVHTLVEGLASSRREAAPSTS